MKNHLSKKEITMLTGPRQSGKTTLLLKLKDYLLKNNQKVLFLNLDIENDKKFVNTQLDLIKKIELEIGRSGFVFIDEIQRKKDAGIFLKGIYDQNLNYKFIVSGSGSLELKERLHESLSGRKRIFELSTISFREFVNYRTGYKYENRLMDFFLVEEQKTLNLLEEYLSYGSYPRVILAETFEEKNSEIKEIFQSYLEKDIFYLLNIEKGENLINLIRVISSQIGKIVNYSEISNTVSLNVQTLKKYLWYLEKTFILKKILPFYKNKRKEITKSPAFYFTDTGMRNFSLNVFGRLEAIPDKGFLFQNFIYGIIYEKLKDTSASINFWRTKDKAEVDFVINFGNYFIPIEVKYSQIKKPTFPASLLSFIKKYDCRQAYVLNLGGSHNGYLTDITSTRVSFLPFYKLYELEF